MEYREFRAKTVNDAVTEALIALEITSDMIEYEVIEEGSSGLLGLFSKDAVIRARRKEDTSDTEELFDIKAQFRSDSLKISEKEKSKADRKASKPSKAEVKDTEADKTVKQALKDLKSAEPKTEEKEIKKDKTPNKAAVEALRKKEDDGKENKITKAPSRPVETESLNTVLKAIFEKLEIEGEIQTELIEEEKVVNINVTGENTGDLIGKRGQTLDAIQYILSIIINKEQESYYRVKLDTNNYRERRQKTLENLAKNMASKVKKTRKKVALEPMNPYERRVIHSYLQSDKLVTTKSEGEEPNRRVVIYYKKS
ncbi:MAG: KH domain-containing protein [Parasporobacterium sp.]|nr:KH domain-containing protein [Parasporobacterium sp.]